MSKIRAIYQYVFVLPILVVATILIAIITIVAIPWKNSLWLHTLQALWARLFCCMFFIPVNVVGLDNIQPGQSYVFVSNHQSVLDVFVIYGWLPVVFKWLMKKEIIRIPLVGTACKAAGHIPVDRKNARAAAESLSAMKNQLVKGVSTVIFPEGTRTSDGQVSRFKRGAFLIAWELELPVIPIRLDGCFEAMKRGAKTVTPYPVTMTVMPPLDLHQFSTMDEAITAVRNTIVSQ